MPIELFETEAAVPATAVPWFIPIKLYPWLNLG